MTIKKLGALGIWLLDEPVQIHIVQRKEANSILEKEGSEVAYVGTLEAFYQDKDEVVFKLKGFRSVTINRRRELYNIYTQEASTE